MNKHFCCGSYEQHGKDIGSLVDKKQDAYGDSFHRASEVMQILYPDGIRVDQYQDVLTMIRVIDKLFRIATKKDAFGESPWKDIAGYGLLASKDTDSTEGTSAHRWTISNQCSPEPSTTDRGRCD